LEIHTIFINLVVSLEADETYVNLGCDSGLCDGLSTPLPLLPGTHMFGYLRWSPAGRRQPQFNPGNRVNAIAGPSNLRDPPQDIPPAAPKARDPKPGFPDLLWCTSGKHYRHQQLFEDNATCSECREKNRRKAQIAAERRAEVHL
jgi:hypothetical protein